LVEVTPLRPCRDVTRISYCFSGVSSTERQTGCLSSRSNESITNIDSSKVSPETFTINCGKRTKQKSGAQRIKHDSFSGAFRVLSTLIGA
jgi:hypothetical protein